MGAQARQQMGAQVRQQTKTTNTRFPMSAPVADETKVHINWGKEIRLKDYLGVFLF